jgi:SAM-dependent methyltransferase
VLFRCPGCGVIFTPPSPRKGGPALYDELYGAATFEAPPVVRASLERLVIAAEPFRRTGRWLDVGFGEGALLDIAEKRGWVCHGSELSAPPLEYGDRRGWTVSSAPENDPRFTKGSFDVVTMIELLEHAHSPRLVLSQAASWLRPGGLLYLTTPNARSLNRWLLGATWSVFRPPDHLTIWTARALGQVLRAEGFDGQRLRAEGFNPCDIVSRLKPRSGPEPEMNRNRVGVELNEYLSASPVRRALKRSANLVLSALGIGDSLKVKAVRRDAAVLR